MRRKKLRHLITSQSIPKFPSPPQRVPPIETMDQREAVYMLTTVIWLRTTTTRGCHVHAQSLGHCLARPAGQIYLLSSGDIVATTANAIA